MHALVDKIGATWAFTEYDVRAAALTADAARWSLVYFDDQAMIFARLDVPENRRLIERSFTVLNPLRTLSMAHAPPDLLAIGESELQLQKSRCPSCRTTALADCALALAAKDAARIDAALARLAAFAPSQDSVFLNALAAAQKGDYRRAAELHLRVITLGGNMVTAALWAAYRLDEARAPTEAKELLDSALQKFPGDPQLVRAQQMLQAGTLGQLFTR
jgi:hypothetical protein